MINKINVKTSGVRGDADRRQILGQIIGEQMQKLDYNDREVAELVQVTAQAVRQYRLGQRQPRPKVLQRLVEVLQMDAAHLGGSPPLAGVRAPGQSPRMEIGSELPTTSGLRVLSIGVSRHWNSAVFASFEPLFMERGIKPIFVPVSSRLEEAHAALDQGIDVLIHYEYLVAYDKTMEPKGLEEAEPPRSDRLSGNRYLALQADIPLFGFQGIHVFANKERLLKTWEEGGLLTDELAALLEKQPFLSYDHPGYDRLVKAALQHKQASIGLLEGTHYQLAAERLYERYQVSLDDRLAAGRSGGGDQNPLKLFLAGGSDLYVGVNRDWLLMSRENAEENRFIILVLPELIDVNPIACLIYKRDNPQLYEGSLRDLSDIWFTGIRQIRDWTADIQGLNLPPGSPPDDTQWDIKTVIAMSHLVAVSRITNRLTGDFEVPLEGDGLKDWFGRMIKHHHFYSSLAEARAQQEVPANEKNLKDMAAILSKYRPHQDWEKRAQEYR